MRTHALIVLALAATASCRPSSSPAIAPSGDGTEVIRAMHARWSPHWHRTMTFRQRTEFPGQPDQTWYESESTPGLLRIDIAPVDSQNSILFRADSVYRFRHGAVVLARPFVHDLLLLLTDVHALPPDTTIARLRQLGFDLAKRSAGTWNGRAVWIVGATPGDSTGRQFWVDQEQLWLVRMLEPAPDGSRSDLRVTGHTVVGRTWHETGAEFYRNDVLMQRETYSDVRLDVPLDPAIFEPGAWRRPSWIP